MDPAVKAALEKAGAGDWGGRACRDEPPPSCAILPQRTTSRVAEEAVG